MPEPKEEEEERSIFLIAPPPPPPPFLPLLKSRRLLHQRVELCVGPVCNAILSSSAIPSLFFETVRILWRQKYYTPPPLLRTPLIPPPICDVNMPPPLPTGLLQSSIFLLFSNSQAEGGSLARPPSSSFSVRSLANFVEEGRSSRKIFALAGAVAKRRRDSAGSRLFTAERDRCTL